MRARALGVVLLSVAFLAVTYAGTSGPSPVTRGHANGASAQEKCVARIGPSFLQFSAYQARDPRARYCKDIPDLGSTTIVIDQGDATLREMTTDVRLLRDVGGDADVTALGSDPSMASVLLDPFTEKHVPATLYPTGIIAFDHSFASPGRYHALVTARNDHGQVYVSEFPFQVGPSAHGTLLLWGAIAAAIVGAALLFARHMAFIRRLKFPGRPV